MRSNTPRLLTACALTVGLAASGPLAVAASATLVVNRPARDASAGTGSVPDAPTAVAAVATVDGALVSFTPPAANGAPITSYIVTASPGGATSTGTAGPVSFTGLQPNTSYTFTVTAVNALGAGPASDPSVALTTLAPPNLSGLKLSLVSFFAATHGGPITTRKGIGTLVTYNDSEAATATVTLYHVNFGVKRGGECVAGQAKSARKRCSLYVAAGSFTHTDLAGKNKLRFSGRLQGQTLKSGLYELRIAATLDSVAGNTVKAKLDVF
jgi:Fibronectin type III domain